MKKVILSSIVSANFILSGCTNQPTYVKPTYDTRTQLKKFHGGYLANNLIGKNNCRGVFPQALLDRHIRGVMSKSKTKEITWIGECDAGLMYGKGSIKITPKEGSNIDYFHLTGFMAHGFFVGDVIYGYNPHNSSQIIDLGIKQIKLISYSDYLLYETPKGYNTSSTTSSNDNGALIGLAAVALAGYGVYKLFGGGSDSYSSSSSSSYSSTPSSSEYQSTSYSNSNTKTQNSQNKSSTNPVKNIYDGGYKSAGGYTIWKIECSSGSTYDAYQENDGSWYSVGLNYGDSYKNLSKSEFADKKCK